MNKTFALLFALTIITTVAITPYSSAYVAIPSGSPYEGTYNANPITASPSVTLSYNGTSYTVGEVHQQASWEQNYGNSSGNKGFLYNSGNLTLDLTANTDTNPYYSEGSEIFVLDAFDVVLTSVSYEASWLDQPVVIYIGNISDPNALSTLSYNLSLGNIPEGHQQIIVTASEEGYIWGVTSTWSYSDSTSAVFNFNVAPLSVSFISPVEGQIFNSSEVPIDFNINESPTWLGFRLNNLAINATGGNTTLTEFANGTQLTNGHYSLTVYAEDSFGNIGKSEPINFTIAEPDPTRPFPVATVAVISVVVVAVVCTGLAALFYRRKHGKTANSNQ